MFLFRSTSLQPLRYLAKGEGRRAECPRNLYVNLFRDGERVDLIDQVDQVLLETGGRGAYIAQLSLGATSPTRCRSKD